VLVAAGRAITAAVVLLVASLIVVQFVRAIGQNVAAAHQLSSLQTDIAALERQRDEQQRELRRLRDPEGAVPEIHDRLRLVRPNEAMVFISPAPAPAATP
jgi:septal ring factor EnvC (AmiA/AmiB activator)